ncbi:MAG: ABC transporter permease, partial [Candidatus Odinarchaeota archaeon]
SQFAAIYLPLSTAQDILSCPGKFNQIIVRTTENKAEEVQVQIESLLQSIGHDSTTLFREDLATYNYLYNSLKNDHVVYQTISVLYLVITGLGIYIMLSRLVKSQRRLVGISQALGYPAKTIIGHYVLFSLIIGFLGSLVGFLIGIFLGTWYYQIYTQFIELPYWQSQFQWYFFVMVLFCPLITSIAAIVPAFRACRMKPVDTIRLDPFSDTASQVNPGISQRFIGLLPFAITVKLPIRNVLRNRRRTVSTIIGLSFSVIISISLMGVFDSFDVVMDKVDEDLGTWDLSARSSSFQSETEWKSILTNTSQPMYFDKWESGLDLTVKIIKNSRTRDVFLSGVHSDSTMRPIGFVKGSLEDNGIVISRRTASDFGLSVGDNLILEHLVLGGPTDYYLDTTEVRIVGIHDSAISLYCFMKIESIRSLINTTTDVVNLVYLPLENKSVVAAQRFIYTQVPGITTIELMEPVLRDRQEALDELKGVLWPALFFSIIFAFVMVINTVTINVSERIRETGTMLTLGTRKWIIARMILIENLLLGLLGLGLGMILGYLSLDYIYINGSFRESLPQLILPVVIQPFSWIFVIGLFILSITLAQLVGIRRAIKVDLSVATKVRE